MAYTLWLHGNLFSFIEPVENNQLEEKVQINLGLHIFSLRLLLLCLGSTTQSTFCNIFHEINNLLPIWQRTKHDSVFNSLLVSAMCIIFNLSKFWKSQGLYEVMISVFINILHYIKGKLTFFDFLHPKRLLKAFP